MFPLAWHLTPTQNLAERLSLVTWAAQPQPVSMVTLGQGVGEVLGGSPVQAIK